MLGPSFYFGDPVFSNQWGPRTLFFYKVSMCPARRTVNGKSICPASVNHVSYRVTVKCLIAVQCGIIV